MDWTQIQTVVRLWSLRPWLYDWTITALELPDKIVDERWRRWFGEKTLIKKKESGNDFEVLDDKEMALVTKVYNIYKVVFGNQSVKGNNLEEVKTLVYQTSSADWFTKLTLDAKKIPFICKWLEHLPQQEDMDILLLIFVCYNYCVLLKVIHQTDDEKTLYTSMLSENESIEKQRNEGNVEFKNANYSLAITIYTKALKGMKYNEKLYSNRAQAHLKLKNSRAAASDGFRCLHIAPKWDRGWVRCAAGLLNMGRAVEAWKINLEGRNMVPGSGPLTDQAEELKIIDAVARHLEDGKEAMKCSVQPATSHSNSPQRDIHLDINSQTSSCDDLPLLVSDGEDSCMQSNMSTPQSQKQTAIPQTSSTTSEKATDAKVMTNGAVKREVGKNHKTENPVPLISKSVTLNNNNNILKKACEITQSKRPSNVVAECKRVRDLLKYGSSAWLEKRMRNAVTSYTDALKILTPDVQMEMGYHDDQVAVVMYALGLSNIHIGSEKELQDGYELFHKIVERFSRLIFPLAYLGMGMTYAKWNRFKEAVEPLSRGLRIATEHALPQVYSWPESEVCIEESNKDKLIERLKLLLTECRQPPKPLAICRSNKCSHYHIEIYLSDPDFNGYVELRCYARCKVVYHIDCWKKSKPASDKEILSGECLTPNCTALLSHLLTYDHTGDVVSEKESKLRPKESVPQRPCKKMKPSSQNTINKRLERKQRRRQNREEERQKKEEAGKLDELINTVESAANNTVVENKAAPEVDLATCTKIMPKREEEEQKLKKKRRAPKEQRTVVRLDLLPREVSDNVETASSDYELWTAPIQPSINRLDDFDEFETFPALSSADPFVVPPHLAAEVSYLEEVITPSVSSPAHQSTPSIPSRSVSPDISAMAEHEQEIFEANNRQAIRESLFQLFKGILHGSGPLHIDDPLIMSQLSDFPADTLSIIDAEGGIGSFLKKSINFTLIDDIVGLIKDSNKIRKIANKRKAQLRKSASNSRSKKGPPAAIPPKLKSFVTTSRPLSNSEPGDNFTAPAPVAGAKIAFDLESDRDSIASDDTACSESLDVISISSLASSGRNKPSSVTSSSAGGVSGKSSPWKRPPSLPRDDLQNYETEPQSVDPVYTTSLKGTPTETEPQSVDPVYTTNLRGTPVETEPQIVNPVYTTSLRETPTVTDIEVVNAYRLGANRLRVAVELGRLALMVNVRLGVEVRLLNGWKYTTGLEDSDSATVAEAEALLKDALQIVTSSANVVCSSFGAEVYFFGLGQSSVEWENAKWVSGPEVGFNNFIVIALALDEFDMAKMTVDMSQLDEATVDTLSAVSSAADAVRGISDRFKASLDIKKAVLPIFIKMGRRVAADDPKTTVLLTQSAPIHKPPPGMAYSTASTLPPLTSAIQTLPGLHSPIAQSAGLTSSGYSNPSQSQLSDTLAITSPSLSAVSLPHHAAPFSFSSSSTTPAFSASTLTFIPPVGGTSFGSIWENTTSQSSGSLSGIYNYSNSLTAAVQDRKQQEATLQVIKTLQQALSEKTQEIASFQEMQKSLMDKNQELQAEIEQQNSRVNAMQVQLEEYCGKAQREMSLRVATETQFEDVIQEHNCALSNVHEKYENEKKRAEKAEVTILQLKLDSSLQVIDQLAKKAEMYITKIQTGAKQYTDQFMAVPVKYRTTEEEWKTMLSDIKCAREQALTSFEDQRNQVMNGICLEMLPTPDGPRLPLTPEIPHLESAPLLMHQQPQGMASGDGINRSYDFPSTSATNSGTAGSISSSSSAFSMPHLTRPTQTLTTAASLSAFDQSVRPQQKAMTVAAVVANRMPVQPAAANVCPPGISEVAAAAAPSTNVRVTKSKNSFDRIVDQIQIKFPYFDRSKISSFLQQLRQSRGGSLSGMKKDEVLSRVESYIEEHYQSFGAVARSGVSGLSMTALDTYSEDDPCTICLEELFPESTQKLDCRHRFHTRCIRKWLQEKSTCPNCNKHALLPDEFPALGS